MEEKNELNDIILNKGGSNSGSKKLLLAIATLTLILIIVLVIMNSLKNDEVQKAPQAILPPEPTAPTEIINDPLFEPVEVIQEGNNTAEDQVQNGTQDLNKVAQKIKEESLNPTPASVTTPAQASASAPVSVPAPEAAKTVVKAAPAPVKPQPVVKAEKPSGTAVIKSTKPAVIKSETMPKKPAKSTTEAAAKPEVSPVKSEAKPSTAPTASSASASSSASQKTYYIQVGSFKNEPNKALFDRLNASGMKYTTKKTGDTTKILVGPFQGEKTVKDALANVRQNVEARAFKIEE